ncbi:hypothetical protein BgiMline_012584 [Biomphalaria glabrata]|nr:hypothetical protein BgiMline_016457 [Biomphalaria glabrata]KAI8786747.1 hypothetical protein BgiBS90_011885 [Biomphalaria glabrata]
MHLYHGIQGNVKKYDADIDGLKDVCEEKAFIGSNSEEARQKDDEMFQNTTKNCASSKYDGSFNRDMKNHEKTLSSRFKKCSQEKFANDSDNLLVLLNYDFSNVTNNISSNGNRNSKDSVPNKNIVKLTRNQLEPKSVTSPIVKFNLDYDKISGTSEMLLSNMFSCHELNKCKETFSDHNLEAIINDSCEKHLAVADTGQSSMVSSTNLTTCPKEETYTDFTDASESYKESGLNNLYTTSLRNNNKKTKVMPQVFTIEAVSENKETILDSFVNHDSSCESEHVVPDISISELMETSRSVYEEGINIKGFEENSKTVFQWIPKSLELTDLSSGDQFSYPSGQMCSRPLRLGLSKKQKVKHLHKK